jgi:hypothetical protein
MESCGFLPMDSKLLATQASSHHNINIKGEVYRSKSELKMSSGQFNKNQQEKESTSGIFPESQLCHHPKPKSKPHVTSYYYLFEHK